MSNQPLNDKKVIFGWAFYDWANSVYALVITTAIFPIFYGKIVPEEVLFFGHKYVNTALYSFVISLSFIIVALLSPILSGIADYTGRKKMFLKLFSAIGSISCISLYFFNVEYIGWSMLSIVMASIGFWGSLVFYNAYLPEIATKDQHDKISAKGYAYGYIGSTILLIICLVAIQMFEMDVRISFVITGLWWYFFAQFSFSRLPEELPRKFSKSILWKGLEELKRVAIELKDQLVLKRYLLAFFVFSMGVQTIMAMAIFFGEKEITWVSEEEKTTGLIVSVILIQLIAIAGAYLMAMMSKKIGNIYTLMLTLLLWMGLCVYGYLYVESPLSFYVTAMLVGFIMGGTQSLGRSTYAKLMPKTTDTASYFSFYDVIEKLGMVLGTFAYGLIENITNDMRMSLISLILFFLLGLILLFFVPRKTI